MGEVDELQDAVHHRVAQSDQRIEAADGNGCDQCLDKVGHAAFGDWRSGSLRFPSAFDANP